MDRVVEALAPGRLGVGFRWLLGSAVVSNLGDGITIAAGPLLVASETSNAILVSMAVVLQRLPWLLFGLHAGVIADRLDRRRIVLLVNLARSVVLLALTASIVTGWVNIVAVLAAMFLLGTAETFADTTSSTLLPMLVDKADLGVANARLMAAMLGINQLVGPPIGAALFAVGRAWPFAGETVCLLAATVLISRIALPVHGTAQSASNRIGHDIREGLSWLWHHSAMRTLALTIVSFNVTFGAAWSVLVLYAADRLGLGAIGFGLVTTVGAVGSLVGTAVYGRLERRFSLGNIMRVGLLIETFTHLALALTTSPWVAMPVFFVFGAHAAVWGTTSTSVRQRAVPVEFQGRVASVYMMGVMGGLVIGAAIGGVIAEHSGLAAPFWFAFVGSAVLVALIWRQLPRIAHDESSAVLAQ
ncbi:MAG: MFS transporter [Jatrophihabitans sp.]